MGLKGRHERMVVTDMNDAEVLLCLTHDEYFNAEAIQYDAQAKRVDIPFYRAFHWVNARVIRRGLLSRVYEVPILRCTLRIENVEALTLIDTQKVGMYMCTDIEYNSDRNRVTFGVCPPLELSMIVSGLHLEYFEMDFKGKAEVTQGLFWDSGPRLIEY